MRKNFFAAAIIGLMSLGGVVTSHAQTLNGCLPGATFNIYTGQACATTSMGTITAVPQASSCLDLPTNLSRGMRHANMTKLQSFLKTQGDLSQSVILSTMFGPATQAAVKKFQLRTKVVASALTPGYGKVGPKTRAMIKTISCTVATIISNVPSVTPTTPKTSNPVQAQPLPEPEPAQSSQPSTPSTPAQTPSTPPAQSEGSMTRTITQYGITWTFDKEYVYGQFANGDYWIQGPVTITSITPDFTGTLNGWEINPNSAGKQGFDSKVSGFMASRVPALPAVVQSDSSVVKVISHPLCVSHACVKTAAVLTVLGTVPPNNGATVFRPPYTGTEKPLFSTTNLRTDRLPSLAPPSSPASLTTVQNQFQRVWLDHFTEWVGRGMHPSDNMPDYGSSIAIQTNEAALRLMLNDPISTKMPAMINYLQYGIDLYGNIGIGTDYHANGGHMHGRVLPLAFASQIINDARIETRLKAYPQDNFHENGSVIAGVNGQPLWGQPRTGGEYAYWQNQVVDKNTRTAADPYRYIDGGYVPGGSYQVCCNSMQFKGTALAAHLMTSIKNVWNNQLFFDYVDRWVTFGAWSQPDPCAPHDGIMTNYGKTYGPNGQGGCIKDINSADGIGRYPLKHGTSADTGGYTSGFTNRMWTLHRGAVTANTPAAIDAVAPKLSSGSPSGTFVVGTAQTSLSLTTNEAASCKYSTTAGIGYSSMTNTFSTTGNTSHSTTVTALTNSTTYNYYVRCQDTSGNANTSDYTITFAIGSAAPSGIGPSSGLVAYYTFDQADVSGASVMDTSGNNNTGKSTNNPAVVSGKKNEALQFNGTNYVVLPHASFNLTSGVTIGAWVNVSALSNQVILARGRVFGANVAHQVYALRFEGSGAVKFEVSDKVSRKGVYSTSKLTPGTWYYVVGSFDGANVNIYINGNKEGSVATGYSTLNANPDYGKYGTAIAADTNDNPLRTFFKGSMDEVRVYNRGLSTSEVLELYNLAQ